MNISTICFTQNGVQTALRVRGVLGNDEVRVYVRKREEGDLGAVVSDPLVQRVYIPLHSWTKDRFDDSDAIIFIGACGIAVRSIAPFIVSKEKDPAILVIDEKGTWVISLLSGHIGGANDLSEVIASGIGAEKIVTTATDLNNEFAVDVFARKNNLYISSMELAKEISAALLDGNSIGFTARETFTITGKIPSSLRVIRNSDDPYFTDGEKGSPRLGINISFANDSNYFEKTLTLIPRQVCLGVGCRKDKDPEEMELFLMRVLDASDCSLHALRKMCTIGMKANEPAILRFSQKYGIPLETYTVQQLVRVPGKFSSSPFVLSVTGVDNVCERSAVLGAMTANEPGRLLRGKIAQDGMTAALAISKFSISF